MDAPTGSWRTEYEENSTDDPDSTDVCKRIC